MVQLIEKVKVTTTFMPRLGDQGSHPPRLAHCHHVPKCACQRETSWCHGHPIRWWISPLIQVMSLSEMTQAGVVLSSLFQVQHILLHSAACSPSRHGLISWFHDDFGIQPPCCFCPNSVEQEEFLGTIKQYRNIYYLFFIKHKWNLNIFTVIQLVILRSHHHHSCLPLICFPHAVKWSLKKCKSDSQFLAKNQSNDFSLHLE